MKPDEEIDHGILVYRGDIPMEDAGGVSRAVQAWGKLQKKQAQEALALAEEAVAIAPNNLYAQWSLGDVKAALGKKDEARAAYAKAIEISGHMEPERAAEYAGFIQESMKKL
jgi:Flp pilus assembly protein TadD